MSDLVRRLRDHENEGVTHSDRFHLRNEAADDIERLTKALRQLKNEVGGLTVPRWQSLVQQAIGNTNWNVLMLRLQEADAELAQNCGQAASELIADKGKG